MIDASPETILKVMKGLGFKLSVRLQDLNDLR